MWYIRVMGARILILVLLVVATLTVYVPNLSQEFISWDRYLYLNILNTREPVATALALFTDWDGKIVPGYYAPIGHMSLLLDRFFLRSAQPDAWFTLLINVLMHCFNGMLVFQLISRVSRSTAVAALASALFLLLPVQVSPVLWFVERKTLVACMFYLVTYLSFLSYRDRGSPLSYTVSLSAFSLGLLSKPTLVPIPIVLALTQIIFLRDQRDWEIPGLGATPQDHRFGTHTGSIAFRSKTRELFSSPVRRSLWPVLPFLAASCIVALITLRTEGASWGLESTELPIVQRPLIAATAVWFYVGKILAPIDLMPIYPKWELHTASLLWWLPLLGLAFMAWGLVRVRDAIPKPALWALANFVIPLVPVLGFVKFGFLAFSYVADHFLYISMVGAAHLLASVIWSVSRRLKAFWRIVFIGVVSCYFVGIGVQTYRQASIWQSSVRLWSHNVLRNPTSWKVNSYMGYALCEVGDLPRGIHFLRRAVRLEPHEAQTHYELAKALKAARRFREAFQELTRALQLRPSYWEAHREYGILAMQFGKENIAIEHFRISLKLNPNQPMIRDRLKTLRESSKRPAKR